MIKFIFGSALVLMAITGFSSQAAILKISTAYPNGTYIVKTLKAAGKNIEAQTEGRVKLRIYPGGVQGDNKTVIKKIRRGVLSGTLIEGGALAFEYKDAQVYNTPLLFKDYAEVAFVRSQMDSKLIEGFARAGWQMFGFIDGGFAYAMTNAPVTEISELKKQKLWLPANDPLSEKVASAMGLSPIYLGVGEVLTALQTGAVNALVAPPSAAITLQWYSRVKHVTDIPFIYTFGTLAIADKAYSKLSPKDQQTVRNILTVTLSEMDEQSRADNIKAFSALQTQGLKLVQPSSKQSQALRDQADMATRQLILEKEFSQQIFSELQAHLMKVRSNKVSYQLDQTNPQSANITPASP